MIQKLGSLFSILTLLACSSHGTYAYDIFRSSLRGSHAPHEEPHVVSLHQFLVANEANRRSPLADTLLFDHLVLSELDIGTPFIITSDTDPEFARFTEIATDGVENGVNYEIRFAHNATFQSRFFDQLHRDVPESMYFHSVGTAHPLFIGPDLTGFLVESIELVLASFTGGPGLFDIDEAEIILTYHGRFRADFDASESLDFGDIDALSAAVRSGSADLAFDLNADDMVDTHDRSVWIHDIKQTYFGDSDLNGVFDSADLVQVLSFGEYLDDVPGNSTWQTGDWNGDGDFTSSDLVVALADGGYEQGPRVAGAAIPEPTSLFLLIGGACGLLRGRAGRGS